MDTPIEITGETKISDLLEVFPEVVDFLIFEYGFYCVNCALAGIESLEEGCRTHGITGEHFEELLGNVNLLINDELDY